LQHLIGYTTFWRSNVWYRCRQAISRGGAANVVRANLVLVRLQQVSCLQVRLHAKACQCISVHGLVLCMPRYLQI
jgi:hypothetical protein